MNELFEAIGVLSEMCGLMRDELMRNGFTRKEAVAMCTEYLITTVNPNKENKKE